MSSTSTGTPMVGLVRAVRAEQVRARGSSAQYFALAGLVICLVQGAGWWSVASRDPHGWRGMLGWQTMYATALLAPMMALLAALVARRERDAREGATWARPLSLPTAVTARMLVMAGQAALFHVGLVLPLLGVGLLKGLHHPPLAEMATVALVLWATALLPLSLAALLSRRVGMVPLVGAALVWQVAGTLTAETGLWWAQPWSWPVHAAMPVLHVHANGVGLEPGSPVAAWNPGWPMLGCLCLSVLVTALQIRLARVVLHPRRASRRPTGDVTTAKATSLPGGVVTTGRRRVLWAQLVVLKSTGVFPLAGLAAALLVVTRLGWGGGAVAQVACWLLVPLGSATLAVLSWQAHRDAWRVLALRRSPRLLALDSLVPGTLMLAALAVLTAQLAGSEVAMTRRLAWLLFVVGLANLVGSLWLAARLGPAVALGVTLVVLVVSLVFGASTLSASGLWVVGVHGWPLNATSGARAALASLASLVACAVALVGWSRASVRAAQR